MPFSLSHGTKGGNAVTHEKCAQMTSGRLPRAAAICISRLRRVSGGRVESAADAGTDIGERRRTSGPQDRQDRISLGIDVGFQHGGRDLLLRVASLSRNNAKGQSRDVHTPYSPSRAAYAPSVNKCWIARRRRP